MQEIEYETKQVEIGSVGGPNWPLRWNYGIPWNPMEPHGTPWNPMEPHGTPWNLSEPHRSVRTQITLVLRVEHTALARLYHICAQLFVLIQFVVYIQNFTFSSLLSRR